MLNEEPDENRSGDFHFPAKAQNSNGVVPSEKVDATNVFKNGECHKSDQNVFQKPFVTPCYQHSRKFYKKLQQSNASWRKSGRKWTPTSAYKREKTPPRSRPTSSSSSDSWERPAVRGRSRVRRQTK
ncbi:hypothetical protein CEXT_46181 [Caerostris extrusa]|uniref:Uncharacterized protein n=1 Tax=Caerostris extrusa TaxID=172846 RepID=A0AAV4RLY8_CAEEX|nr:hypothetical protein CEXT_46181 [Caerostris extrusa]